jgi:hypothetical protein
VKDLQRTLIAKAARHMVNRAGLLAVRRPDVCWKAYVKAGGPCTANRRK